MTQFDSDDVNLGEIDFLHAFRPASISMLERLELKEIFDGHVRIPVIQPEDLIGLKVQAIANSPPRMAVDLGDIEGLMQLRAGTMDWQRIEEYFALFSMMDLFNELKERYHAE